MPIDTNGTDNEGLAERPLAAGVRSGKAPSPVRHHGPKHETPLIERRGRERALREEGGSVEPVWSRSRYISLRHPVHPASWRATMPLNGGAHLGNRFPRLRGELPDAHRGHG